MKKISLLIAFLFCMGISKSFAGSFTILNITPCSFQFYSGIGTITDPATGALYGFNFGPFTANQGTTSFASPNLYPGIQSNAQDILLPYGCVEGIKVIAPGGIAFHMTASTPYNQFNSPNAPACNNGNTYSMFWNANGCDVVILIM
ncbi:hypothetical protein [Taibaiella chishuiensis]|uniref:Uncharacterized protein n=1 Tax=Taibaiella chishuiensis TaxID=1434707 RepID=A0A2P8D7X6_9BACT|nr:hypothetical protein [Taibaiella chishuiensis]PSK93312.1 hypothetical protein B0I18_102282 [Taibaiella chishuiensis]